MEKKLKRKKTTRREQWDLLKDSQDYWQLAFELVTQGQHLREIANSSGAKFSTWYSYVTNHPDILAGYQAALAARAEVARERIELLTEEILAGDIEPKAARVALEALKWRAEAGGGRGSQFRQDKGTTVQVAVANNTNPFSASYLEALRMHNQSAPPLINTDRDIKSIPLDNTRDPILITSEHQRESEGLERDHGKKEKGMELGMGKGLGRDAEGMGKGSGRDAKGIDIGIIEGMEHKGTNQRTATDHRAHETATALRGFTLSSSRRPRSKRA